MRKTACWAKWLTTAAAITVFTFGGVIRRATHHRRHCGGAHKNVRAASGSAGLGKL